MTIWQVARICIVKKYASFDGRASRSEFFCYTLLFCLFCIFWLTFIYGCIAYFGDFNLLELVLLYVPFLFLPPLVAVCVRRLHDSGRSGWLLILLLIPFINIFGFALLCMRGYPVANKYGQPGPEVDL